MNKTFLFKIQRKYLDILNWLIQNGYVESSEYNNNINKLEERHNSGELFIYGNIKTSRNYDYIESGCPSKKDLIEYSFEVEFEFLIGKTLEVVKGWHKFINSKHGFPSKPLGGPFKDCYMDCFADRHEVQTKTPYKFGVGVKQSIHDCNNYELEYFIPIKITYTVGKISIEPEGLTKEKIHGHTII